MSLWRPAWRWVFQWPEWWKWRDFNWINFYPIRLGVEAGKYKGRYVEVECVILGVGFVFELYEKTTREVFSRELNRRLAEVEDGHYVTLETCGECEGTGNLWLEPNEEEP